MTQDFLRNFKVTFGNLGQNMQDFKLDYLHFGIKQKIKQHWFLQLMVSLKKWIKFQVTKLNEKYGLETSISTTN